MIGLGHHGEVKIEEFKSENEWDIQTTIFGDMIIILIYWVYPVRYEGTKKCCWRLGIPELAMEVSFAGRSSTNGRFSSKPWS